MSIIRGARPITELGVRVQEHGRIRFGEKGTSSRGKQIPRALKTWRFTSPDREAILSIAELYGGNAQAWSDPKANPQNQWEVKTTASTIRVFLPPDSLSVNYELWSGAGCQRRCDGVTAQVLTTDPNEPYREVPCLCNAKGNMECKPKTRLNVILPEIRFGGVWRMETGSWNASEELPAMERMLATLQAYGVLEARLSLVEQSIEGGSKQYVIPRLEFSTSTQDLIDGATAVVGLPSAKPETPALTQGEPTLHDGSDLTPSTNPDDEVIDAEIVEEPTRSTNPARAKLHALIGQITTRRAEGDRLRHALVHALTRGTSTSSSDLTDEQVSLVIGHLEEVVAGTRRIEWQGDTVKLPKVTP